MSPSCASPKHPTETDHNARHVIHRRDIIRSHLDVIKCMHHPEQTVPLAFEENLSCAKEARG
eukprot:758865-Hanusia_phi.AAC.4